MIESFEFFKKRLVSLCKVHFLLTIWQILKMVKLGVCLAVGTIKNLVLLQVHLDSSLVREIIYCLFELYEIRNTCKAALHSLKGVIYCSFNWLNVTILGCCVGRVRLDIIMSMLLNAMLAQRLLVRHAERVNNRVVLVTIKYGCRRLR